MSLSLPLCSGFFVPVQVALGNDYVAQVDKHSSQKDASKGFGGKFGVERDRVDKVGTQVETIQETCSLENGLVLFPVGRGLWVQRRSGATHVPERSTRCSGD